MTTQAKESSRTVILKMKSMSTHDWTEYTQPDSMPTIFSNGKSDHQQSPRTTGWSRTSVKFAPKDAPLIGSGWWTWPLIALKGEPLIEKIIKKGIQTQKELEKLINTSVERQTKNPQQV